MNTRDKILQASLALFNEEGPGKVSVQNICDRLGISKGNFHYHFKQKEGIMLELYEKLLAEIDQLLGKQEFDPSSVLYFLDTHKQLFHIQHSYRFFYLNLFEILRHYPRIKSLYLNRYKVERTFALQALYAYMQEGVLIADISEAELNRLIDVGYILNNSWASDAEIHFSGTFQEKMTHYLQLCCGRLAPYLTTDARQVFDQYFENLKKT